MENDRLNEIRELNPDYDISMQSINLQFNCNDIASSLKAQRDNNSVLTV